MTKITLQAMLLQSTKMIQMISVVSSIWVMMLLLPIYLCTCMNTVNTLKISKSVLWNFWCCWNKRYILPQYKKSILTCSNTFCFLAVWCFNHLIPILFLLALVTSTTIQRIGEVILLYEVYCMTVPFIPSLYT